jgi:inner membrane protein YidH
MPRSEPQPVGTRASATADLRVYLAAERTFLAWIRTGLALMGFGFVVARFGLFLREVEFSSQHQVSPHSGRFTLWVGTALILIGVIVNLFSALHHVHFVRAVRSGVEVVDRPVTMAVAIALILAVTGVAMTIYLVFVR